MSLLIPWLVFPLALGLVALGWGLLLERASSVELPGVLLLPAGLASMIVVGLFLIVSDATADLTTPVLVVGGVAGLVFSPRWRRGRLDPWAIACAGGVFAAYAAPTVLSGEATFVGYMTHIDAGTWLGLTDRIMEHGRSLAGLPDGTYSEILSYYLPLGYPLGAFVPLGAGSELVGQDPAWTLQPYLALCAAMLALALYALSAPLIASPRLRALAVFVASQPALLFNHSLFTGIKELTAAWTLALVAALVFLVVRQRSDGRALLPLAVAASALLGSMSFAAGLWLLPPLTLALVLATRLWGRGAALAQVQSFLIFAALLSVPTLAVAKDFWEPTTGTAITGEELGVLLHPLSWRQVFGIWPTGDFRTSPENLTLTNLLIGVLVAAAVAGLVWAWRRRAWEVLLYVTGAVVSCLVVTAFGSPWVDSKALAIASPSIVLAAMLGALSLRSTARGMVTVVAVAAIGGGVLWSNVSAYHDVRLAPRGQMQDLERIGDRFAGQGPTLLAAYEPYAARHFLRETDVAPGPSSVTRNGANKDDVDIDRYRSDSLLSYRTIVRRRSPISSRPPSVYRLAWTGRYYEVWQRPERPQHVVAHIPLGSERQPVAKPRCRDVLRLAPYAGPGGRLAFASRPPAVPTSLAATTLWTGRGGDPVPPRRRSGVINARVTVPVAGRYAAWVSGSFNRKLELSVDGRALEESHQEFNFGPLDWVPLGTAALQAGRHTVRLRYGGGSDLAPGTGGYAALARDAGVNPQARSRLVLGPLVLTRAGADSPVRYVDPSQARTLCGKELDWMEAVGP